MGGGAALEELLLAELSIRSRLNALVHERAEALGEAQKLHVKATRAGGDPRLAPEAERWQAIAERVAAEIKAKHVELRDAEAAVAAASAAAAEGGAGDDAAGAADAPSSGADTGQSAG